MASRGVCPGSQPSSPFSCYLQLPLLPFLPASTAWKPPGRQPSLHLRTTQQNGRLATGKAQSAGSGSGSGPARPPAKPPGVSDGPPLKRQHPSPLQVPTPRLHGASRSPSRGHFYRQPVRRCRVNRCQASGPGDSAAAQLRAAPGSSGTRKGAQGRSGEGNGGGGGGTGAGDAAASPRSPGAASAGAAPLTISRHTKAPE